MINHAYKVGDKVVFKSILKSNDIFTIHTIGEYFIGVKRTNDDNVHWLTHIDRGLLHATDEEVKVRCRL